MKIYDISVPLFAGLPAYPGDPPVELEPVSSISRGDLANVTRLTLTTHSGTHLDAGRHFDDNGLTVDLLPLTLLIGKALVVELAGVNEIGPVNLQRLPLRGHERVLFKTDNSALWEQAGFVPDYGHLTVDAARYLLDMGVRLVGIDYLSVESIDGDGAVHRLLLGEGAVILEGLNLAGVAPGEYELICLPLKVRDGDGAPVRAVLRTREEPLPREDFDPHSSRWPLS